MEIGFYKSFQVYRCKSCGREFTELSKSKYVRHRFPKETILFSVMLYRYGLSSYTISEVLRKKFRIKVSPRTIYNLTEHNKLPCEMGVTEDGKNYKIDCNGIQ